jgi:hypothetical protein
VARREPPWARPLIAGIVALMVASALFAWEPWPFTSFRLFSHARVAEQQAWRATAVEPGGEEVGYPLGALPEGFRGFPFVMREFVAADERRRDELCRVWVEAAPRLIGRRAEEVRLYLRRWSLAEREGDRAAFGDEGLVYVCTVAGVRDAR